MHDSDKVIRVPTVQSLIMCGIFGIRGAAGAREMIVMSDLLRHRGPDDEGFVFFGERVFPAAGADTIPEFAHLPRPTEAFESAGHCALAFGHRRLSIIDVGPSGHQPMSFGDGRYWIVYNGEIYNFRELRRELEAVGHRFRSRSDTEVVLAAFAQWGIAGFERLLGMFAFALHDRAAETTFLVRDRYGIKPLYYRGEGSDLVFASEIKAIRAVRSVHFDRRALCGFLLREKVPDAPGTFYENVRLLEPGHYLEIRGNELRLVRWYKPPVPPVKLTSLNDDFAPAVEEFSHLLQDSVHAHLVADVPVAFCLSGGPDSSSIVSIVAKGGRFKDAMHTFSAVFPGTAVDEKKWMDVVIGDTGVLNHFTEPDADRMLNELEALCLHQDEPVTNQTVYVEWCVMRLVKEMGIKVVLNGHGADELLSGYGRGLLRYLAQVRREFGEEAYFREVALFREHNDYSDLNRSDPLNPPTARVPPLRRILNRIRRVPPFSFLPGRRRHPLLARDFLRQHAAVNESEPGGLGFNEELFDQFFRWSLPRQLVWADKSSMAFSVECRVPFMEKSVVENAFSRPGNFKCHDGWTKWPLRAGLKGILHDDIRWRTTKCGYTIPAETWFPRERDRLVEMILERERTVSGMLDVALLKKHAKDPYRICEHQQLFRAATSAIFLELD